MKKVYSGGGLLLILSFFGLIGPVLCDSQGGGRRHGRRGRTNDLSAYGQQPNYQNDGGIFSSGFHTDNADFGNQYSAQNVQPTYGSASQQPQYGNAGGGQAQYGGGAADSNIAMLEKAVPGVPGQDYPIYAEVPETGFECDGQVDGGYYADPEAECQVFHICTNDGAGGLTKYSFLCPNGTVFSQQYFICDWWFNFDCSEAEAFYSLNDALAEEREAATQALLEAASSGQATYASPASNSYGAAQSSNSYSSPSNGGRKSQRPRGNAGGRNKNKGGGGRKKNNNRGQSANQGYGAPASSSYGAAASSNYGAPSSQSSQGYNAPNSQAASTSYGAPASAASTSYGAPASSSYGSPAASDSYGAPDYEYEDSLPSYGKRK